MRRLAITALLLGVIGTASVAYAATVVLYPGLGVSSARLGATDSSAVKILKRAFVYSGRYTNRDYAQPVYEYRFGRKLGSGHYPVEMYAKKSHSVFLFEVNTPLCVTSRGVRVGSTEAQLKAAYGFKKPTMKSSTYYIYSTGGRSNRTDYYVSRTTKKLTRVIVSRY